MTSNQKKYILGGRTSAIQVLTIQWRDQRGAGTSRPDVAAVGIRRTQKEER